MIDNTSYIIEIIKHLPSVKKHLPGRHNQQRHGGGGGLLRQEALGQRVTDFLSKNPIRFEKFDYSSLSEEETRIAEEFLDLATLGYRTDYAIEDFHTTLAEAGHNSERRKQIFKYCADYVEIIRKIQPIIAEKYPSLAQTKSDLEVAAIPIYEQFSYDDRCTGFGNDVSLFKKWLEDDPPEGFDRLDRWVRDGGDPSLVKEVICLGCVADFPEDFTVSKKVTLNYNYMVALGANRALRIAVCGEKPVQAFGDVLPTNKLVAEYVEAVKGILKKPARVLLQHGFSGSAWGSATYWYLTKKLGVPPEKIERLCDGRFVEQTCPAAIADWLAKKIDSSALYKKRVVHIPGGGQVEYTYADRLDEITPADLVNGQKTDPEVAFAKASERIKEEYLATHDVNHKFKAPLFKDTENIRRLTTPQELIAEGKELNHCIGAKSYIESAAKGDCVLYSVNYAGQRSSFEVAKTANGWKLIQHMAMHNADPSSESRSLVKSWCRANGIKI